MFYSGYKGQCVGRLLLFLFKMNSRLAETCYFGDDSIYEDPHCERKIASFIWNNGGDGDIPIFTFTEKYSEYQEPMKQATEQIIKLEKMKNRPVYSLKAEQEEKEREKRERWQKIIDSIPTET